MNIQSPLPLTCTEKFALFNDQWPPKAITQMNGYQLLEYLSLPKLWTASLQFCLI